MKHRSLQTYLIFSNLASLSLEKEERISKKPRLFYKSVNNRLKISNGIGSIFNNYGELCKSGLGKAKVFASFFRPVYTGHPYDNVDSTDFISANRDFLISTAT